MLRPAIALLAVVVAGGSAESADRALPRHSSHRAAVMLPAGLPRPHYHFRTTITYRAPVPTLSVYETPEQLYAPGYIDVTDLPIRAPPPPLPGYYYGDPYTPYWDRLPYACGVYGYC
jgi:hypothetical protein